jgi:hypothetical protein
MEEPVARDPLLEGVGQPVVEPIADVARLERIARPDRVEHRHRRLRRLQVITVEVLPLESRPQVMGQIARDERGAIGLVGAAPVRLSVRVVQGGVEGARHDEGAQLRDRCRQAQLARELGRRLQVLRLERGEQVDGVARVVTGGGDPIQPGCQQLHCPEPDVV